MLLIKEIIRFNKVIVQTVITPLINSSLYLLIFGISIGSKITLASGHSYLSFIIPGLVMMGVLNNAYQNSSTTIVTGKFSGDLQDLKVVPLSDHQIIWALALGGVIRGLFVGSITLFVGEMFQYFVEGQWLAIYNFAALLFFAIMGGLIFALMGISVAFWARTFDQLSAISSFLLTPLIYLGGVFFSLRDLHEFWRAISLFNPLLYLINGVRYGMLGSADVSIGQSAAVAVATLIVFFLIAMRALKKASFRPW